MQAGLTQHAYFLSRDLSFLRDQEPILEQELRNNVRLPTHSWEFRTQIWNPRFWVVTKHFQGTSEVIPTVLHTGPAKTLSFTRHSPPVDKPVYLVAKETILRSSSAVPGWRWRNFCYRTWSWTLNFLFFFSVVLPWCSPFSLRALLCPHPFLPDYEVSQLNGSLHQKPSSLTQTLASRLRNLWRHISKSRTDFEAKPDRGLLGKSVLRHFNRFVNYIIKGVLGSLLISLVFPLLCLLVTYCSLFLALLGPALVPACSGLVHLLSALFYDIETRRPVVAAVPSLLWNLVVQGTLQPLLAFTLACILCPLTAGLIASAALLRRALRTSWDTAMFHAVIRKRARVPAGDSFIVRRTAGPGMASNYFYQIKTEQALVSLEARMEIDELEAYKVCDEEQIITTIMKLKAHRQFMKKKKFLSPEFYST